MEEKRTSKTRSSGRGSVSRCPKLFLAPMEGVGCQPFRKAIATIGGFDEASTEFLRVPCNAHVSSLAKKYAPNDTYPIPQAAQIMGSIPHLMAEMTLALIQRGAPRVDLNCGCPSNTVTGRGAGSSLLKTPDLLYEITKAMADVALPSKVPVTVKLRSGFNDTTLFSENLLAAQEAGAAFITLHPRTKFDGYKPPADWSLIARAKKLLKIPLVGNGDIKTPQDVVRMLEMTGCDAIMIGRGAVIDPWIFHKTKALFQVDHTPSNWEDTENYIRSYFKFHLSAPIRTQINQLKQLGSFLFQYTPELMELRPQILTCREENPHQFLEHLISTYGSQQNSVISQSC